MKQLLSFLFLLIGIISCTEKDLTSGTFDRETNSEKLAIAEKLFTTEAYSVPAVEGYTTVATYKGTVLARTNIAMDIMAPKDTAGIKLTYVENEIPRVRATTAPENYSNLWQTILFEDSKSGDFDYNDVVIHTNYKKTNNSLAVAIHPIALGARKNIKLGFKWSQGNTSGEEIVAENCRAELFGSTGANFINTPEGEYTKHYDEIVKTINVSLPTSTEAFDIAWFIEVDGAQNRIYAVNANQDKCIDDNGMPYGFAITDASITNQSNVMKGISRSSSDDPSSYKAWNSVIPNIDSWIKPLGATPQHPGSDAIDMAQYKAWEAKKNTSYIVNTGSVYSGEIQTKHNSVYYVYGKMDLTSMYGSDGTSIVNVMPGGTLNLSPISLQNIEIKNYGGVVNISEGTIFSNKSAYQTDGDLIAEGLKLKLENNSKVIANGDVKVASVHTASSNFYAGSITAKNGIETTNGSIIYVAGSIETATYKSSGDKTDTYCDCSMNVGGEISVTNNTILSVRSHIKADKLIQTSESVVNVNEGSLTEVGELSIQNVETSAFNSLNKGISFIAAEKATFNGLDLIHTFKGYINLVSEHLSINGDVKEAADFAVKNLTFNADLSLNATECHGGYNSGSMEDNGLSWFAYPLEQVHINTCYDFDAWRQGNFDFTKKKNAKVFDIFDTNPKEGEHLPIYKLSK